MARLDFEEPRPDLAPHALACEIREACPMRRAEPHNEIELNLVDAGSLTYLMGGRRITLRPRRLSAFWAATPHQVLRSPGVTFYYVVTVPLAWVLGWGLPEPFVQWLMMGALVEEPDDEAAGLDMMRCGQWHADLAPGRAGGDEAVLLEIKARLLRLAASTRGAGRGARSRRVFASGGEAASTHVAQMAGYVARHYREPIGLDDIARAVGLHPDYATALFRKSFGVTPTRLVVQHRIAHAQRELVTSDAKILKVALEAGFGSLSRFNAAFRLACGCSPREYRRAHRV